MDDEQSGERRPGGWRGRVDSGGEDRSASELLAEDRGRLRASLRAASPEEIRELLQDEEVRARIEQGLADLKAGRVLGLDEPPRA